MSTSKTVPLKKAKDIAAEIVKRIIFNINGKRRKFKVIPVGSVRRQAEYVKDIDFLVIIPDADAPAILQILDSIDLLPGTKDSLIISSVYAAGSRRRSCILQQKNHKYKSDFFITTVSEKPYALYHYTGPKEFNIRTRAYVKNKGWLLNQYGLFVNNHRVKNTSMIKTERDLAQFLGVTYYQPKNRSIS